MYLKTCKNRTMDASLSIQNMPDLFEVHVLIMLDQSSSPLLGDQSRVPMRKYTFRGINVQQTSAMRACSGQFSIYLDGLWD